MRPTPPTRRHLLGASGALAITAMLPLPALARAKSSTVCRVLAISDLHSAYERTSQLLAAFEHEVRSHPAPHVIALNGDIFEQANVVSVRSDAVIDWAFLAALPRIAPTVVNLGNHDNDVTNDLAEVVERMRGLGLHVVTHLHDSRTGQPYADPVIDLPLGERRLRVVGIGTDALHTYPKTGRELLSIPAPQDWAAETLANNLQGSDLRMVLCHVGVAQERLILPHVPPRSLVIGGHNHLLFTEQLDSIAYAHSGSWNNAFTVAEFDASGAVSARNLDVYTHGPDNPELTALIAATLAQHLSEAEQAILGHAPSTLSLGDTGRKVAQGLATAANTDIGFIGHTTLGTGVQAGPVSQFAFDAIVRFDGKLMMAEVSPDKLRLILQRANQDRPLPLAERTGDFAYASAIEMVPDRPIRMATNDWCAMNQHEYFGTTDLVFVEVPSPGIKAIGRAALLGH